MTEGSWNKAHMFGTLMLIFNVFFQITKREREKKHFNLPESKKSCIHFTLSSLTTASHFVPSQDLGGGIDLAAVITVFVRPLSLCTES